MLSDTVPANVAFCELSKVRASAAPEEPSGVVLNSNLPGESLPAPGVPSTSASILAEVLNVEDPVQLYQYIVPSVSPS